MATGGTHVKLFFKLSKVFDPLFLQVHQMITVPMRMSFTILLPFVYIVSLEKGYELSNTKF